MKELNIKQKAEAYDKAINEAIIAYKDEDRHLKATLERIFPELSESEDERIRKELVAVIDDLVLPNEQKERFNAWLEKQGEQSPVDKVEPKFKVGKWYQCTKDFFGKGVTFDKNTAYYCAKEGCLQDEYGCHIAIIKDLYDNFKLWTIKDAKAGDVLANDHNILILKESVYDWYTNGTPYSVKAYCGIKPNGNFEIGLDNWSFCGTLHIHPATKEQRDILFQKMKEDGYEWNTMKKQLKKTIKL